MRFARQPTTQAANQTTNEQVRQSTRLANKKANQATIIQARQPPRSANKAVNQQARHPPRPINKKAKQTTNQPINGVASHSTRKPTTHQASQPVNQSTSHIGSHWGSQLKHLLQLQADHHQVKHLQLNGSYATNPFILLRKHGTQENFYLRYIHKYKYHPLFILT